MDLATRYMGLTLKNPFVASASPISHSLDAVRRLEDHGAAAVVLFSLFEEQIEHDLAAMDHFMAFGTESVSEALSYFPAPAEFDVGPSQYLDLIRKAAEAVDIPIIASLNGTSPYGWVNFASLMQDAGAAGLELNVFHIPTEMARTGADVEAQYLDVLAGVRAAVRIPVAVKLGPYFSAFANMAARLDRAGADALVLFNRFYQPDFDIETRTVVPALALSTPVEIRLPLLWIALLHGRVNASLAATTGVHGAREAIKYLMAGADAVMTTSAVLQHGPSFFSKLVTDVTSWMEAHGYSSVRELRGSMSQQAMPDTAAFVRANYIRILESFKPASIGWSDPGRVAPRPAR
jgi:dihydroorotate dehydrogenase (fumarate)